MPTPPPCEHSPEELRAQGLQMLRDLRLHLLNLQQLLVAEAIVRSSLCLGRPAAWIPVKKHFALALAMDPNDLGNTLAELKRDRIIQTPPEGAEDKFYVPLPDSSNWGVDIRSAAAGERKRLVEMAWIHHLHAQGFEQLDIGFASDPSLDDALAELSRAEAAKNRRREVAPPSLPPTNPAAADGLATAAQEPQPRLGLTPWQAAVARLMADQATDIPPLQTGERPATLGSQTPGASGSRGTAPAGEIGVAPIGDPPGALAIGAAPIGAGLETAPPGAEIGAAPIENRRGTYREIGAAPISDGASAPARVTCKHVIPASQEHASMLPAPKPLELEGELSADAEPGHVTRGVEEHVGHVGLKGELRPLREHELDIWEELDRLLPEDELLYRKGSFGKTWHLRIQDYPSAVRAAVGEVRRMHVQGRIRKTLGGALNDQFKRFKLELYKGG